MVGIVARSTASTVSRPRPGIANTLSVTTDAADQQRDADADHRDDRHRGVAQRMAHQHARFGQALGAGGADVVLGQRLEHAARVMRAISAM